MLGDGIRRNVASVSSEERNRLLKCFIKLDSVLYPDGVTKWDKQEQIHKNAHQAGQDVHEGPAFIPWHREIVNRMERLLRKIDPQVSLHYWDWTTDPRHTPDGKGGFLNLFTSRFMGRPKGLAGPPFDNFESTEWIEDPEAPRFIWRNLPRGKPKIPRSFIKEMGLPPSTRFPSDKELLKIGDNLPKDQQFHSFDIGIFKIDNNRPKMIKVGAHSTHDLIHGYIGGTISNPHFSFHDPFVFLIHSNLDRLWAMWQTVPGKEWRKNPEVYGIDGNSGSINSFAEPWGGGSGLRPWSHPLDEQGDPDNAKEIKDFKHTSIVSPPKYDTNLS